MQHIAIHLAKGLDEGVLADHAFSICDLSVASHIRANDGQKH